MGFWLVIVPLTADLTDLSSLATPLVTKVGACC
jgi:hypothetical protein